MGAVRAFASVDGSFGRVEDNQVILAAGAALVFESFGAGHEKIACTVLAPMSDWNVRGRGFWE